MRFLSYLFIFSFLINIKTVNDKQYINKSYIVMETNYLKVIEGNNIHDIRSVASISKVMSAIIVIENANLDEKVEILKEDLNTYGSSVYLKEGEVVTIKDLLYGLLLRSGNDASMALARVIGGSKEGFVFMMNEKAKELNMKNTIFNNPNGLDELDDGNLSTSYDMALLASYCFNNPIFNEIVSTKRYRFNDKVLINKNKLLFSYSYLLGGKTGFTNKARRTLLTCASNNNLKLVVVTLDCGNDFNFHKFLYEKNFNKYELLKVLDKGDNYIYDYLVKCKKNIDIIVSKNDIDNIRIVHVFKDNLDKIYIDNKEMIYVGKCKIYKLDGV